MSFITFFSNNKNEVASIIFRADVTTPQLLRTAENRFATDKPVRQMLCRLLPEFFSILDSCRSDLLFRPYQEGISLKRMDEIFPRPKLVGRGKTCTRPIVIINSLGKSTSMSFDADYLLAYQPASRVQRFSVGIMHGSKVTKLCQKIGDQWKMSHKLSDWDFFHEFPFTLSFSNKDKVNDIWTLGIAKIIDECYACF